MSRACSVPRGVAVPVVDGVFEMRKPNPVQEMERMLSHSLWGRLVATDMMASFTGAWEAWVLEGYYEFNNIDSTSDLSHDHVEVGSFLQDCYFL